MYRIRLERPMLSKALSASTLIVGNDTCMCAVWITKHGNGYMPFPFSEHLLHLQVFFTLGTNTE
jgi:hypothetical protein